MLEREDTGGTMKSFENVGETACSYHTDRRHRWLLDKPHPKKFRVDKKVHPTFPEEGDEYDIAEGEWDAKVYRCACGATIEM